MLDVEALFTAATLGAHSNFAPAGFRQREVRFLVDLFLNWHEARAEREALRIHNTQIARYLDGLARAGEARRRARGGRPRYALTRSGLLALVTRLVRPVSPFQMERFLLSFHFLESYRPRLEQLIAEEGVHFPRDLRLDLEGLLDSQALLREGIGHLERELTYLDGRIGEAGSTVALAGKLIAGGAPFSEVVARVEAVHPYELNNQKPLSALFAEIPESMKRWELTTGNLYRKRFIWEPRRAMLAAQLTLLRGFVRRAA